MKLFGLIGYPLSHSFSKRFFTEKFEKEGISNCRYELFPLKDISKFPDLIKNQPDLVGLNVTIPYKEVIIKYLDELSEEAKAIGAVNVIKINDGKLTGYNSDVTGFEQTLKAFLPKNKKIEALVLGTGGAAKGVAYILKKMNINFSYVSRVAKNNILSYTQLDEKQIKTHHLIINTTPLGMTPKIDSCPEIPYEYLTDQHFLYDLVYNPEKTLFLTNGEARGCAVQNGLPMLYGQALRAWDIWKE